MTPVITKSRAIERQLVEEALRQIAHGERISYAKLSELSGTPIQDIRHVLYRARRELTLDGFVFEVIKNSGLRRMTDAEIAVAVPAARRGKIHRQSKRGMSEVAAIQDATALSEFERSSALIGRSLFGAICALTTRKAIKAIAENVARTQAALPVSDTIEAFRKIG